MPKVDIIRLQELVRNGYLTARPHPNVDLIIWNYTAQTQYDRYWIPETILCRGLITTNDGTIVARPFPKFFNFEEYKDDLPLEPFTVTLKMDGSLGILYFINNTPYIATRGSFTSKQATFANSILQQRYRDFSFSPHYTYLFEIVYPSNRIVVDYGDMEELILLAVINTETGKEINMHDPSFKSKWPFPIVKIYDGVKDIATLREMEEVNQEGFVIRFQNGLRLKFKFAEYVRLHRLLTKISARVIWEYRKDNKPLTGLLDRVPEDFETWVRITAKELTNQYLTLNNQIHETYKRITDHANIPTPFPIGETINVEQVGTLWKMMSKHIKEQFAHYPDIESFLLILYNEQGRGKKEYLREAIWKSLYPEVNLPFRMDEDT